MVSVRGVYFDGDLQAFIAALRSTQKCIRPWKLIFHANILIFWMLAANEHWITQWGQVWTQLKPGKVDIKDHLLLIQCLAALQHSLERKRSTSANQCKEKSSQLNTITLHIHGQKPSLQNVFANRHLLSSFLISTIMLALYRVLCCWYLLLLKTRLFKNREQIPGHRYRYIEWGVSRKYLPPKPHLRVFKLVKRDESFNYCTQFLEIYAMCFVQFNA